MAICHCEQSGGYFPLIVLWCTVVSRYYELGYLEPLAISNTLWFPLILIYIFQYFTIVYLSLGYLESPAISNTFSFPLIEINLLYEIYILDYTYIFIIY